MISLDSITLMYKSQDYHKVQTNDPRPVDRPREGYIKTYVLKQKGGVRYIERDLIKSDISKYKVLTPDGAHKAYSGFGNIFVGQPNEVHLKTYISFEVDTLEEANSLESYHRCRMPNFLLSLTRSSAKSLIILIILPFLFGIITNIKSFKIFNNTINPLHIQSTSKSHSINFSK